MSLAGSTKYGQVYGRLSPWRAAFASAGLTWFGVKLFLSLISVIVTIVRRGISLSDRAGNPTLDSAASGFFGTLHHWDSSYFAEIAVHGYFAPNSPATFRAFFPGYPLLARELSELPNFGAATGPRVVLAMWIISSAASFGAAVLIFRLAERLHSRQVACWSVVFLLAGPYSVFLFADYSESLFLLFAIAAWYLAVSGRWALVAPLAAAATFTRINGVFLVAALLVMYVVQTRAAGKPVLTCRLWWFPAACSGIIAYFGYLAIRTGDGLAWFHAQANGWGHGLSFPWQTFYQTAGRVLFASTPDRRLQFGLDIVFVGLIVLGVIVFVRRKKWPEVTYLGLTVLAFATSFTFVSAARNSVTLFPLSILVAFELTSIGGRPRRAAVLASSIILFGVNTTLFANGYWTD